MTIISGSIFLGMKACYKSEKSKEEKNEYIKYDAIEYFKNDLDWFMYFSVFFGIDVASILYYFYAHLPLIKVQSPNDLSLNFYYRNEVHLLIISSLMRIY
jgi:hypothetical protein